MISYYLLGRSKKNSGSLRCQHNQKLVIKTIVKMYVFSLCLKLLRLVELWVCVAAGSYMLLVQHVWKNNCSIVVKYLFVNATSQNV